MVDPSAVTRVDAWGSIVVDPTDWALSGEEPVSHSTVMTTSWSTRNRTSSHLHRFVLENAGWPCSFNPKRVLVIQIDSILDPSNEVPEKKVYRYPPFVVLASPVMTDVASEAKSSSTP